MTLCSAWTPQDVLEQRCDLILALIGGRMELMPKSKRKNENGSVTRNADGSTTTRIRTDVNGLRSMLGGMKK